MTDTQALFLALLLAGFIVLLVVANIDYKRLSKKEHEKNEDDARYW